MKKFIQNFCPNVVLKIFNKCSLEIFSRYSSEIFSKLSSEFFFLMKFRNCTKSGKANEMKSFNIIYFLLVHLDRVHWMILYKLYVFRSDMKFKMAATTGLSLTLDPMGKMFHNASSLKPLG
jgi:hypothetical protein